MDLFDFFFPEQAQAKHLRTIAAQRTLVSGPSQGNRSSEVEDLRKDVQFLTLVVAVLLKRLGETETASLADIQDLVSEVDALDGVQDGGLDPGVLRGLLGILKSQEETPAESDGKYDIVATPRYRQRRR